MQPTYEAYEWCLHEPTCKLSHSTEPHVTTRPDCVAHNADPHGQAGWQELPISPASHARCPYVTRARTRVHTGAHSGQQYGGICNRNLTDGMGLTCTSAVHMVSKMQSPCTRA